MTASYKSGGLAIKLPGLMNIALGRKLTWSFLTGENTWWKTALEAKYLNGPRNSILDKTPPIRPCTQIWKAIINATQLIRDYIIVRPGNGEQTSIWEIPLWEATQV